MKCEQKRVEFAEIKKEIRLEIEEEIISNEDSEKLEGGIGVGMNTEMDASKISDSFSGVAVCCRPDALS